MSDTRGSLSLKVCNFRLELTMNGAFHSQVLPQIPPFRLGKNGKNCGYCAAIDRKILKLEHLPSLSRTRARTNSGIKKKRGRANTHLAPDTFDEETAPLGHH